MTNLLTSFKSLFKSHLLTEAILTTPFKTLTSPWPLPLPHFLTSLTLCDFLPSCHLSGNRVKDFEMA